MTKQGMIAFTMVMVVWASALVAQDKPQTAPPATQEKPVAPPAVPVLAADAKKDVQLGLQTMSITQRAASPDGLAESFRKLMEEALRNHQAASQAFTSLIRRLTISGCNINLDTFSYEQDPASDKKCEVPVAPTKPKGGGL